MNVSVVPTTKKQTLPDVGEPFATNGKTYMRIGDSDGRKVFTSYGATYIFGVNLETGVVEPVNRDSDITVLKPVAEGKIFQPA